MFSAGPIDDLINFYSRPEELTLNGVWGVLLTASARDSAEFGRRYFEVFNGIAGSYWHLAVCAKMNPDCTWAEDARLQAISDTIRAELRKAGRSVPQACIVFFDPNACEFNKNGVTEKAFSDGGFAETCLIVSLDFTRLADVELYTKGFIDTHRAILAALQTEGVNPGATVESDRIPYVLNRIRGNMATVGMMAAIVTLTVGTGKMLMERVMEKLDFF